MVFTVFIIAWLIILVIFVSTKGKPEENPVAWLCLGVILLTALYTLVTVNLIAGLGMIGSLGVFEVARNKNASER